MKTKSSASLGLLLLTFMFGCSGKPSMSELQEKFERDSQWTRTLAAGAAKVKTFEKVDALMTEVAGVKHYTMGYKVEMECTAPFFIIEGPGDEYEVYLDNAEFADLKRDYQGSFYMAKGYFVKELKPGDVDKRTGSVELTLFEKGWR